MTATTVDLDTEQRQGKTRSFSIAASTALYAGTLLCFDTSASNVVVSGTDAADRAFAGINQSYRDNAAGAAGDLMAEVYDQGEFAIKHEQGSLTDADIGKRVYLKDNATVDFLENVTNPIYVGCITGVHEDDADYAWVKIEPDAPTPAHARGDRLYQVEVAGVNATAFDLDAAAVEYGGTHFYITNVISVQSYVTSGGASDGLKVVTTDWTLAAGVLSAVGDETSNTWLVTFLGYLQDN